MKTKIDFITDLLSNKKLHASQKERLFSLVAEDLKGDEHEVKKIWEEIEKLKFNHKDEKASLDEIKTKPGEKIDDKIKMVHNPQKTSDFLKMFKYDNDEISCFKLLVHKPLTYDNFNFEDTLNVSHKEYIKLKYNINRNQQISWQVAKGFDDLHILLKTKGLDYNKLNDGKHPYEDHNIAKEIQSFKQNYRFAGEASEASVLIDKINNCLNSRTYNTNDNVTKSFSQKDTSGLFNIEQIKYIPSKENFYLQSYFFVWVPSVIGAINRIIDDILKHSNIEGNCTFKPTDKRIDIELYKDNSNRTITLSILDNNSLCMNPEFSQLIDSVNQIFNDCAKGNFDYKIQFKHIDGNSYEISQMTFKSTNKNDLLRKDIQVDGFKYILNFYT